MYHDLGYTIYFYASFDVAFGNHFFLLSYLESIRFLVHDTLRGTQGMRLYFPPLPCFFIFQIFKKRMVLTIPATNASNDAKVAVE